MSQKLQFSGNTQQVVRILWLLGSYAFETFNYTDTGHYTHPTATLRVGDTKLHNYPGTELLHISVLLLRP